MFSFTALTLPGSVTTRVFLIVPAIGLDNAASGVCLIDAESKRCTIPGACRSIRGDIA